MLTTLNPLSLMPTFSNHGKTRNEKDESLDQAGILTVTKRKEPYTRNGDSLVDNFDKVQEKGEEIALKALTRMSTSRTTRRSRRSIKMELIDGGVDNCDTVEGRSAIRSSARQKVSSRPSTLDRGSSHSPGRKKITIKDDLSIEHVSMAAESVRL
jgi:hypothetical protein